MVDWQRLWLLHEAGAHDFLHACTVAERKDSKDIVSDEMLGNFKVESGNSENQGIDETTFDALHETGCIL